MKNKILKVGVAVDVQRFRLEEHVGRLVNGWDTSSAFSLCKTTPQIPHGLDLLARWDLRVPRVYGNWWIKTFHSVVLHISLCNCPLPPNACLHLSEEVINEVINITLPMSLWCLFWEAAGERRRCHGSQLRHREEFAGNRWDPVQGF